MFKLKIFEFEHFCRSARPRPTLVPMCSRFRCVREQSVKIVRGCPLAALCIAKFFRWFFAGRSRVFDRVGAWLIGAYLLMYKFNEYGPFRAVPLDLSAVSYFLFGVAAFVPFRPLKAAGSFSAMLSGSVYFFTMILYPETHVENLLDNRWFLLTMAMVNHNVMFFGGMLVCAEYRFERTGRGDDHRGDRGRQPCRRSARSAAHLGVLCNILHYRCARVGAHIRVVQVHKLGVHAA